MTEKPLDRATDVCAGCIENNAHACGRIVFYLPE